jgi:lipopolysaccharide biosynthesis glycosyltransferase
MLDSDLFVLRNPDELFQLPELAGSPMIDTKEKISFWKSPSMGLVVRNKISKSVPWHLKHWSGLNSGVTVLIPSNATLTGMLNELSILPNRPCCPSQEFLFFYFEERRKFYRLPPVYNARMLSSMSEESDESIAMEERAALLRNIKIYHFVGAKPWKRLDTSSKFNRLWWRYRDAVVAFLEQGGLSVESLDSSSSSTDDDNNDA